MLHYGMCWWVTHMTHFNPSLDVTWQVTKTKESLPFRANTKAGYRQFKTLIEVGLGLAVIVSTTSHPQMALISA